MSPSERRIWERLQRRAAATSPDLNRAILRVFQILKASLSERQLADLIRSGGAERIINELVSGERFNLATSALRAELRTIVQNATEAHGASIPKPPSLPGKIGISFNFLNPRVVDAVRTLETRVITTLQESIRDTVRQTVQAGIEAGESPIATARQLRSTIGLSPYHERVVRNFRSKLEGNGDPLENKLRDRRFDSAIKSGSLTETQIDKMVEAYERKLTAFNAETNARTASLDAQRLGQRLSYEDAIDKGIVDRGSLWKRWRGVMDSRERPEHVVMEGEEVPFDQRFSNGQMIPGDTDFNCRCVAIMFIKQGAAA